MATRTLYLKDAAASGSSAGSLSETAPSVATTTTLLATAATDTAARSGLQVYGASVSSPTDPETFQPSGAPVSTASDCWRSELTYSESYVAGIWQISVGLIGTTGSATAPSVGINFRLWRSSDPSGIGAVEITSGVRQTGAALVTTAQSLRTLSVSLPLVSLAGEYLFFQVAWDYAAVPTTAAANASIRVGSAASFVATPSIVAPSPSFWRSLSPKGPSHGTPGASGSPVSRFRSPQAFVPGPDQAPPGSASFWKSFGPSRRIGKASPWNRFRSPQTYTAAGSATAPASPGTANFTFPLGQATGQALVGAAPGTANFTSPAGKATGAALALAVASTANFSSPLGKATGAALVGAHAGAAAFSQAAGKATGAALALAAAGSAVFGSPPGKATGAGLALAAAVAMASSSPASKATGQALTKATAGQAVFSSPLGKAVGDASGTVVGAAPGSASFTQAPSQATGAASVGAAPGQAAFSSSGPATAGGIGFPGYWRAPRYSEITVPATVGARAGEAAFTVPAGLARGGRSAVVGAAPALVLSRGASPRATGAAIVQAAPSTLRAEVRLNVGRGFHGPTVEALAAVLLAASDHELVLGPSFEGRKSNVPGRPPTLEELAIALLADEVDLGTSEPDLLASLPLAMAQGQAFADALTEAARQVAAKILARDRQALVEAVQAAGPDEMAIRAAVLHAYAQMERGKLAKVTHRVLILGELAGRLAAHDQT